MEHLNRPIRKNYANSFSYRVDLLFYYIRKNRTLFFILIGLVVLGLVTWVVGSMIIQTASSKALVLIEKVYDDLTLYVTQNDTVTDKAAFKEKIIPTLNSVKSQFWFTPEATRALYYLGVIAYVDKDYQNAIKYLKVVSGKKSHVRYLAVYGIIQSYIQLANTDAAFKSYSEAIKFGEDLYKDNKKNVYGALACFALGKIYELKNDLPKAVEYYQKIEKEFSSSSLNQDPFVKNNTLLLETKVPPKTETTTTTTTTNNK